MPEEKKMNERNEKPHKKAARDRRRKGYRVGSAIMAGLFLTAALLTLLPVHGEREVFDAVLRLHVLANSDSDEDQARKLQVRDAVLAFMAPRLSDCATRDEAEEIVRRSMPQIGQIAVETLAAAGCDDPVTVTLGQECYPTRNYETCCFPAGEYLSLRICIGEAAGANWWCVLFPPLCLSAARANRSGNKSEKTSAGVTEQVRKEEKAEERAVVWQIGNGDRIGTVPEEEPQTKGEDPEEAFISVGLTPDQYRIITETERTKYKIRFRILEIFESIFHK